MAKKYRGKDRVVFLDGYGQGYRDGLRVIRLRYTDAPEVVYRPRPRTCSETLVIGGTSADMVPMMPAGIDKGPLKPHGPRSWPGGVYMVNGLVDPLRFGLTNKEVADQYRHNNGLDKPGKDK